MKIPSDVVICRHLGLSTELKMLKENALHNFHNPAVSGIRGLMLAALLAGLMSTLTSVFNSASSVVTLDLWTQFRKKASQAELMVVGRVTVLVLIVVSILWLPILQGQHGGLLWFYMAAIVAYLGVPWCVAFILALFWNRTSEPVGLSVGLFLRF